MSVRIGINPLTWTIDDLPEVGGETSLETCLTEARAAGFEGVELGCKFPRTAPELKAALAPHGLALVSGWYSAGLLLRDADGGIRGNAAASRAPGALGCERGRGRRDDPLHPRRPPHAALAASGARTGRLAAIRRATRRAGSPARRTRAHARLPSPHGHGRADRGRGGPPDGLLRRRGRTAARYRPPDLRRRRSRAGGGAPCRRASRTCTARTCAGPCSIAASIAIQLPRRRARRRLHRARRRLRRLPGGTCSHCAREVIAAGSWSRRSRTRASRRPRNTRTSATAICAASRTRRPGNELGVRPPRIPGLRDRHCPAAPVPRASRPRPAIRG